MSANMTAASLRGGCRPGGVEGLPEFLDPMGSPIAQFLDKEHYHTANEAPATRVSIAECRALGRGLWVRGKAAERLDQKGRRSATSKVAQPGMTSTVSLRPSRPEDYNFALELYLESTRKLLIELGRWDESRVVARFKK